MVLYFHSSLFDWHIDNTDRQKQHNKSGFCLTLNVTKEHDEGRSGHSLMG